MLKVKIVFLSIVFGVHGAYAGGSLYSGAFQRCDYSSDIDEMMERYKEFTTCKLQSNETSSVSVKRLKCVIDFNGEKLYLVDIPLSSDVLNEVFGAGGYGFNELYIKAIIQAHSGTFCKSQWQLSDVVSTIERFNATP